MFKKVLIVEDEAGVQEMMKLWVETLGYQALTAGDGLEAIKMVKENHPDLILMDIMMPDLDGIYATRKIRELEGDQIPIIILTAHDAFNGREAYRAGCNVLFSKPINFEKLEKIMNQYLL